MFVSFWTNVQVPLRTITTKPLKSGVLSGNGLQASSTTVGSLLVAKMGRVELTGKGKVLKYVIGSCVMPWTVAFCNGITVLSVEATEIASIAFPGEEVKNAPFDPSFPCAVKMTWDRKKGHYGGHTCCDCYNLSRGCNSARNHGTRAFCPSICPAKRHGQDILTISNTSQKRLDDYYVLPAIRTIPILYFDLYPPSSVVEPSQPKILYAVIDAW